MPFILTAIEPPGGTAPPFIVTGGQIRALLALPDTRTMTLSGISKQYAYDLLKADRGRWTVSDLDRAHKIIQIRRSRRALQALGPLSASVGETRPKLLAEEAWLEERLAYVRQQLGREGASPAAVDLPEDGEAWEDTK